MICFIMNSPTNRTCVYAPERNMWPNGRCVSGDNNAYVPMLICNKFDFTFPSSQRWHIGTRVKRWRRRKTVAPVWIEPSSPADDSFFFLILTRFWFFPFSFEGLKLRFLWALVFSLKVMTDRAKAINTECFLFTVQAAPYSFYLASAANITKMRKRLNMRSCGQFSSARPLREHKANDSLSVNLLVQFSLESQYFFSPSLCKFIILNCEFLILYVFHILPHIL